jgi:hypothetical protein
MINAILTDVTSSGVTGKPLKLPIGWKISKGVLTPPKTKSNSSPRCDVVVAPNVDLSGCDLSGMNFAGADLSGANFSNTNLTRTDFHDANLAGANFTGSNWRDAIMTFIFPDGHKENMSNCKNCTIVKGIPRSPKDPK